ncbi:uncharacterized protein [Chamaea fasciata]|uniref:uncharacterized protein n=1 Tax=Chamaea fasciata TaxID=190680 RepID=UPI00336A3165
MDSRTPCIVPVDYEGSLSSEEISSEDLSVKAEPESPLVCPSEVPDAAPVLAAPLPAEQVPAAAAAAPPAQFPGADIDVPVPEPPRPESPRAPRPRERGRRLSRDPGSVGIPAQPPEKGRRLSGAPESGSILAQPPKRGSQPSRPPQPRPAPQDVPQPRAPVPTAPSEPPAQAPQVSHEGAAKVSHQMPPTPPPSLAPIQARRPSRGTEVPRLGARRLAARWVLPEVKVVDVSSEPDWGRAGPSRSRTVPSGVPQVVPGTGRARKAEPQLCDPWLAAARLAPGVTVRWGRSERRGPALPGYAGHEDVEEDEEAVKRADKELKPILAYPECRLSEYDE